MEVLNLFQRYLISYYVCPVHHHVLENQLTVRIFLIQILSSYLPFLDLVVTPL